MKIGLFADEKNMCYNTLNFFISKIEEVLQRHGIQTKLITKIDSEVIHQQFDALIGLNRPEPALQSSDGRFLLDLLDIPFFNIVVDPPYYHAGSLKSHAKNLHLIFPDKGHVEYCKKYYMPCKSIEMGYLIGPIGNRIPYEERTIDILFTGGCSNYNNIKADLLSNKYSAEMQDVFLYLINSGINTPKKTTEELLLSYLHDNQIQIDADDFDFIMNYIGTWSEYYLRSYYREKIIRLLIDVGLHITIAGGGWDSIFPECPPNLTLLGSVDMIETADLTANAKILLNVMPWFKDGLHDRIPTAMHNGTVCVTDSSSYINEHFQDGENIVLYQLSALEDLPDKCKFLLEHPQKAQEIAQSGQRKAESEYNWEQFTTDYILKWL